MRLPPQSPRAIMKTNRGFKLLIGFSLLVFCQTGLAAESNSAPKDSPIKIQLELSDTQTHVAKPIELAITITAPTGIAVSLPPLKETLGPFDIVGHRDINDVPFQKSRRWQRRIQLESLMAGELEIPAIEIGYVDRRKDSDITGFVSTTPKSISVISNFEQPTSPQQLRDIKSVVFIPEPESANTNLPAASTLATTMLLALGFAAVIFAKRKSRISPRRQILNRLNELQTQATQQKIGNDEALVCLSTVARDFSKFEYQISAPELTTNEFLTHASSNPRLTPDFKQLLSNLLTQADLIKFAGAQGLSTDIKKSIERLTFIVKQADLTSSEAAQKLKLLRLGSISAPTNMETN